MTQKGKNINRKMTQDIANNPKITVAPSSFSKYLKTLAASIKTSLASCKARIIEPIWKNLPPKKKKIVYSHYISFEKNINHFYSSGYPALKHKL